MVCILYGKTAFLPLLESSTDMPSSEARGTARVYLNDDLSLPTPSFLEHLLDILTPHP